MNLMSKCGGRKFLMALATIGAAMWLEIQGKGLSPTMAGFLASIVGLFSAANYVATNSYNLNKNGDPDLHDKVDDLHATINEKLAPEKTDDLRQVLINIQTGVAQTQNLSGQTAQALLNLNQVIQSLRK